MLVKPTSLFSNSSTSIVSTNISCDGDGDGDDDE
eukprot:CAMPEP_0170885740 /NCGR_PEP_ID=MMETSP0734-20130129/36136_1 /TAXON_ID=186038 /ORGANISM="Fragilariopsis kerguelensis, Strain L26-C5" /LENGTH=33 /DNA_ID= /DNA_START= /DNA_END= /DNA_ORIENTATION=